MSASQVLALTSPAPLRAGRWQRVGLWGVLVVLLLVGQSTLVWLSIGYERNRAQEKVDEVGVTVAAEVRQALQRDRQDLQALLWNDPGAAPWREGATRLLRDRRELLRIEHRDAARQPVDQIDAPYQPPLFAHLPRSSVELEVELACAAARRDGAPAYSRSYFVPQADGLGQEVVDLCLPVMAGGQSSGYMVATVSLPRLLAQAVPADIGRDHELSFVMGDGTRLARAGVPRGAGVFQAERLVDLPGLSLQLRVDSRLGNPQLIPNLATALVLGLSLALGAVVLLLARDVQRRAGAEAALAEALAFRKAMENSLATGLRARDLQGRITFVNPAFCRMVGFDADTLKGQTTPPYWPPELIDEYLQRQQHRLDGSAPPREGDERVFMRPDGERFPVMVFESPLLDGAGRHTGWMSAVLDISAQRRAEDVLRQQQERVQATARLATVGEMASMLSHELNQPLAAINSYATGSLNLMDDPADDDIQPALRQALGRIAEQAGRAGRVIKSVHDFVRRREQAHEVLAPSELIDAVMPLVRLQARKSGTRISVDIAQPLPRVRCDRTMLEQVLLNLARNGLQSMDGLASAAQRELVLAVQAVAGGVRFSVTDHGAGIADEVAQRLFTPFFTTRSEG
ncbi:MAG: hypothetical protein RLZZ618_1312, partial [Pseudomonadota bacterium]